MAKKQRSTRRWIILGRLIKKQFPKLLKRKGVVGVEVGVFKGQFTSKILELVPGIKRLYAIDPYKAFKQDAYPCRRTLTWDQGKWNELFQNVVSGLMHFGKRVVIIRKTSKRAARSVPEGIDFVFIDGNHTELFVAQDIRIWDPKVRSGGIVSGHDYNSRYHSGVTVAVNKYAAKHGREVQNDPRDGVWWWIKP